MAAYDRDLLWCEQMKRSSLRINPQLTGSKLTKELLLAIVELPHHTVGVRSRIIYYLWLRQVLHAFIVLQILLSLKMRTRYSLGLIRHSQAYVNIFISKGGAESS